MRRSFPLMLALGAALALLAGGGAAAQPQPSRNLLEVVVTLPQPALAVEVAHNRTLAAAARRSHSVDVRTPAAVSYLSTLAAAQHALAARLAVTIPAARVAWHYSVALDGVSVVLPSSDLGRLRAIPGATVWPTLTYHALRDTTPAAAVTPLLNRGPTLIGATALWGPNLATAGEGIKIGLVDDGIDQAHPYFNPVGFSYPAGFPKGNTAYTTPKVIVARAFPSPSTHWKYADRPYDPTFSFHATHVAGIAAGDYGTPTASNGGSPISGIAPKAYLGNYKALTVPTADFGLDGNSPEIAKAIDQAVTDGMNVINLSIGEPEVEPRRDIVVRALDNAAVAGVVPVVAAGNDFEEAGSGSIDSPANTPAAITAAASTLGGHGTHPDHIASFSSGGPTPVSLELKPDVTAPGVGVLSSVPAHDFELLDGTSMAAPHVSGAVALLLQRHPTWSVEQVKSALASTGDVVHPDGHAGEVSVLREGGGRIDLVRADQPLIFTNPTSVGWGLVGRGFSGTKDLATTDAGGGKAPWSVSIQAQSMPAGAKLEPVATSLVAGAPLVLKLTVSPTASAGDGTGFVVLTRGSDVRRIAFWFHVEVPKLQLDPHRTLHEPGLYHGDTSGKASRVSSYRYPERGLAGGVRTRLGGPEEVYRYTLRKPVANFGIVVVGRARGVVVSPRLVAGEDENRVVGYAGIPASLNPYQGFSHAEPVVGAVLPEPGSYEFVFDTPTGSKPGAFTFRFWVNDVSPPSIRLLGRKYVVGQPIRVAVRDEGSGVDPHTFHAKIGGRSVRVRYADGVLSLRTKGLRPGKRVLIVKASDWQETKNMEDVGPVLPNTRVMRRTVTLRR
ncbi:MAG TPA: S8 family serine peptidase [Gaiellaceae bacterium]|nr:S8 family serine peptidase [Gaiellaceae bacterium]